nr:serine hydrolase domain-containing protein [Streptomyces albus]
MGARVRIPAYVAVPASVLVALAGLLAPPSPPAPGSGPQPLSAPGRRPPPAPLPGVSRGFDAPYHSFAPPDTVLHRTTPGRAGLDPAPIDAFARRLAAWTNPADGAGYLFPGATALLAHEGSVVARFAKGDAVRYAAGGRELPPRQRVAARPDTIWDLASLSKLFTTLAAVRQVDAGRLRLSTPVARYLPRFAAHGKSRVTLGQLLTHTSGLPPDPRPRCGGCPAGCGPASGRCWRPGRSPRPAPGTATRTSTCSASSWSWRR